MIELFIYLIRLAKANASRRHMSIKSQVNTDERRNDAKNGTTLLCIAILFIACQTPKILPDVYEVLYCNHTKVGYILHCNESILPVGMSDIPL